MAGVASVPLWNRGLRYWRERSLIEKFTWAGGTVMIVGVLICGMVITNFVRSNVLYHRAVATALFVDSTIAQYLRDLRTAGTVGERARAELDALLDDPKFTDRIPYLEIWSPDGTILYSNSTELVGRIFELPDAARQAFTGEVVAAETDLGAMEHTSRDFTRTFTEIYTPLRGMTGEVVAVSEIHEASEDIWTTLAVATLRSWTAVGLTCLAFWLALFSIVWRASRVIDHQEKSLARQLAASRQLAERNAALRRRALDASRSMTEFTDRMLRTVGADLHDGPSQLISFATLKVERARRALTNDQREVELGDIETSLGQALNDIRNIATGLALPAIDDMPLADAISQAIGMHVERTGTDVGTDIELGTTRTTSPVNVCAFRFAQEGLNNAFRHSKSGRALVEARIEVGSILHLAITTFGPGEAGERKTTYGMGLKGLQARVDTLGGTFSFTPLADKSILTMSLDLKGHMVDG